MGFMVMQTQGSVPNPGEGRDQAHEDLMLLNRASENVVCRECRDCVNADVVLVTDLGLLQD